MRFFSSILVGLVAAFGAAQTYQNIFVETFLTSGTPDASRWEFEQGGGGWGNNELQYYTNRIQNAYVQDGALNIEARLENFGGRNYTSARIKSKQAWTYGRYEVIAKIPRGRGTWPAIWMLPQNTTYGTQYWPDNGEIDMMEHVGYDPNRVFCTVHTKLYNGQLGNPPGNNIIVSNPFDTYQTYVMIWQPDSIRLNIGTQTVLYWARQGGTFERWPFDQPFQFRLNVAVGGNWGGIQGVDNSVFPAKMTIDSVRVARALSTPYGGSPHAMPGKVQAEKFDEGGEGFGHHDVDAANLGGGTFRNSSVDISAPIADDNTPMVGWMGVDEWLTYTIRAEKALRGPLSLRVATPNSGRSVTVLLNDRVLKARVALPNTGSWDAYQTVTIPDVVMPVGTHKLQILADTDLWNLNWWSYSGRVEDVKRPRGF